MKNKHRIKQGLSLLLAGGIALTNLGAALPVFAEDAPATPENAEAATPETAEADTTAPNLVQITENLYNDLPDAPTGSYLGSMGLPVATGETKIGISAWVSDLYDGVDAHMDADALNADENTVTIGKTPGTDYAIVPLLAQVEYPTDGAVSKIILPDGVELLSYRSTDYEPIPADNREQAEILHQTYSEQSAAATGLYVKASADFTAQLVYTDSDGSSQSKSIHVQISEDAAPTQMYADTGDDGIAAYAAGPTPPYATGKITSIAKEGGTWLIWFNGQEAYCCSHGMNGQPKGCPTYSFSHVSRLEPGQYTPGNHYANQVNIWGGLGQLSLDMLDDRPVVASLEDDPEGCEEQPDILGSLYDETQQWIMENYPDSYAAQTYIAAAEELVNGTDAQSGENGYYTYIYNPPAGYAWQVVALVGEEIAGGTEIPDVPSVPEPKYYSAAWTAPAQSAGGSFDLTFTVNTDKYQQNTLEKVDGAVITVTPSRTGGSVDGGSWQMTPAAAQTITTSGHTQDDSFHLNGGDGSATWTVHYEVSKTSTSTLSGQEGPFTSQAEADAAAEAAKNAAIGQLQNEAQGMVDAAIASARAQLANVTFAYDEINIPHGFDSTPGALGSHQTITVPANSSNDYKMKNDEWSVKVSIDKIDSETKQRIKGDAEFKIFEWDVVRQCYIPNGGYNQYKVERQSDGTYKVINHSDYAGGSDDLFYTQRNEGKFVIVESRAPSGYYGDWTDVTKPGTAGSVLGKRAYAFEITKALDGQTIWLGNADYNADISTTNSGGTLIDTGEGVVTITFGSRNADKTYATDPTGMEIINTLIHPALTLAVRDGYIRFNPSDGVMMEIKKSHQWEKTHRHALTIEEQSAFLNYIASNEQYKHWLPMFTLFLGTGCRVGEIVGLRWEDCDFKQRIININHTLIYRLQDDGRVEYHITTPKTEAGIREIPMMDEVYDALVQLKNWQVLVGDAHDEIDGYSGFILTNRFGNVCNPHTINRVIERMYKGYNKQETEQARAEGRQPMLIRHFSVHNLRHTFCTRFCENETNLKVIQDIMGHADITTTMNIYAEATKEKKQQAMANLNGKIKIM